ncbi:MAG: aldo/keto reductase [Reichenbachiella sp.]|uniref:aldo/keto reductase n=1 Tax=Reichenbachiella sp. TaxID=2184521 RepID=UPI003264FD30
MNTSSKLILGTVQFGLNYGINNYDGKVNKEEAYKILDLAGKNDISALDTAAVYGNSESVIGSYLNGSNNKFKLITKLASHDSDWKTSLNQSLKRLKSKKVETVLFHSYKMYRMMRALDSYQDLLSLKGKVYSNLGVSVYSNDEMNELLNDDTINIVQAPFNLLDNESKKGDILKKFKDQGKTVHVRSTFLQGLFFMKKNHLPADLQSLGVYLDKLRKIASAAHCPLGELAIKYVLSKEYIDGVLIGVDSVQQLELNLEWSSGNIDSNFFDEIDNISVEDVNLLNPSTWNLKK